MTFRIIADELPRFMACNGSRLLAASVPPDNTDTTARDEGTAAHHMAVQAFNNAMTIEEMVNRKAPNGVYMTEEMAEAARDYLDTLTEYTGIGVVWHAMEVQADHENVSGRADYAALLSNQELLIPDFKYGWRIVEPNMNWTLISHAIAIARNLNQSIASVTLAVFQPRPHHPGGPWRTWKISYDDLLSLGDKLHANLRQPNNELHTSNHCNRCHALATCPAARKAEMNAIDATDMAIDDNMNNADLSFALDNLSRAQDMIKARYSALEELAQHRIKSGQIVENYSVEMGLGKTRYKPGTDMQMIELLTGKKLTEPKPVTPAEAKRRGVNPDFLATITERPPTGVKLVRITADQKAKRLFDTK